MLLGTLRDRLQVLCLGTLLLAVPPAFRLLAAKWYPDLYGSAVGAQHHHTAETLHRKFWRSALTVVTAVALVLLIRCLWKGGLSLTNSDWLRIAAVVLALIAALGRGGWQIQSWKGNTVVERIDRGLYMIEQLGAAALLIFALTL